MLSSGAEGDTPGVHTWGSVGDGPGEVGDVVWTCSPVLSGLENCRARCKWLSNSTCLPHVSMQAIRGQCIHAPARNVRTPGPGPPPHLPKKEKWNSAQRVC